MRICYDKAGGAVGLIQLKVAGMATRTSPSFIEIAYPQFGSIVDSVSPIPFGKTHPHALHFGVRAALSSDGWRLPRAVLSLNI